MTTFHGRIGDDGRVVIPAPLRHRLRLTAGRPVVIEDDGDAVTVRGADRVVRDLQAYFRQFVPPGRSLVDELIAGRRASAAREAAEEAAWRADGPVTGSCVLDASAVLALLLGEPGADVVDARRPGAVWSAVNYAEVLKRLGELTGAPVETRTRVDRLGVALVPFDADQAAAAAALWPAAKPLGLSLADRCCLALARSRGLPVVTGDRRWSEAGLDLRVVLIR